MKYDQLARKYWFSAGGQCCHLCSRSPITFFSEQSPVEVFLQVLDLVPCKWQHVCPLGFWSVPDCTVSCESSFPVELVEFSFTLPALPCLVGPCTGCSPWFELLSVGCSGKCSSFVCLTAGVCRASRPWALSSRLTFFNVEMHMALFSFPYKNLHYPVDFKFLCTFRTTCSDEFQCIINRTAKKGPHMRLPVDDSPARGIQT